MQPFNLPPPPRPRPPGKGAPGTPAQQFQQWAKHSFAVITIIIVMSAETSLLLLLLCNNTSCRQEKGVRE